MLALLDAIRSGERLDEGPGGDRHRADAGRLLSALSDRRAARPAAGRRRAVRPAVLLLPPRAVARIRRACRCSACANTSASARPSRSPPSARRWLERARDFAERCELPHRDRRRQRSVLRPRRQDDGDEPARPGAQVRAADPDRERREPDRLPELQLSSGPFRLAVGHQDRRRRDRAHRLRRLRHGASRPRSVQASRLDIDGWPNSVRAALTL